MSDFINLNLNIIKMNDNNEDDVEVMLQKRIEAMLSDDQPSKAARSNIPQYDATDLYVEELLSKVGAGKKSVKFAKDDDDDQHTSRQNRSREPQKPSNGKQDDSETQKYVRDLMKSVF